MHYTEAQDACISKVPEVAKASMARVNEAQVEEDEIIQFRLVLKASPRSCILVNGLWRVVSVRFS